VGGRRLAEHPAGLLDHVFRGQECHSLTAGQQTI